MEEQFFIYPYYTSVKNDILKPLNKASQKPSSKANEVNSIFKIGYVLFYFY